MERIYSLNIFTFVSLKVKRSAECNLLIITVKESWYIYPLPFVQLQDNDWKKISYGLSLYVHNLSGWNETLWTAVSFGYDPKVEFFYSYPYIFEKDKIDMSWDLYSQNEENQSITAQELYGGKFNSRHIGASFDLTKRFDLFNKLDLTLGYDYIANPVYIKGISASNGRIDRTLSAGVSYTHDTRDLAQFPSNGLYFNAGVQFKGLGFQNINYRIASVDFRAYKTFYPGLTAKFRVATRFTFGSLVPYYDYSFIGYAERIRGNYYLEMEGRNSYIGSFEVDYPLIKDIFVSMDFIPVIPHELLQYRFGLYLELYADAGTVTDAWQKINAGDFRSGYGTGLAFLFLPYSIIRTELAFNEYRKSEVIITVGTSF